MIKIISKRISPEKLKEFLGKPFSDMVKFVVDIEKGVVALGGELHSDAEALLLEKGCLQKNLWGGNLYPDLPGEGRIVYTSMINIRPSAGNRSMELKDEKARARVKIVLDKLIL
ncbi:MAG: hypothetical protein HYZ52_00305 [Candidatus Omnitrophica bacterium]|nr:hypothetical protein [Candidatus Omnitrophota bacterium]